MVNLLHIFIYPQSSGTSHKNIVLLHVCYNNELFFFLFYNFVLFFFNIKNPFFYMSLTLSNLYQQVEKFALKWNQNYLKIQNYLLSHTF